MRDILDPEDIWAGTPGRAVQVFGNKAPVALNDTLTVLKDSGAVTVNVLANDFDPEGQPLTLVSASAALGTVVAETDQTVTYTPPPGISGFDTVVYTVADDLGQTRSAQVDVTIAEPQLSVNVEMDSTLSVDAETGLIDITVTLPAALAGTWQVDVGDLVGGPLNLAPPTFSGTLMAGEILTASDGLWINDVSAGVPSQSWQWRRAGTDIPGATAANYAVSSSDIGQGISVAEVLTDGMGQRIAVSAIQGTAFQPTDDTALVGWWDADDATTLTVNANSVSAWADKVGTASLSQVISTSQPTTGTRTLNGRNVLDFDGTKHLFGGIALPANGNVAFHLALEIDATSNIYEAVLATDAANQDFQIDAESASQFNGRLNAVDLGGSPVSLTGGPFAGALILSVVFDLSGSGTAEVYVSNVLRGSMTYQTALSASPALHLMTNRSRNAWVDGAVAELIVSGDPASRSQHHAYLAAKWGLV